MRADIEAEVTARMDMARGEAIRFYTRTPDSVEADELIALAYAGLAQAGARWEDYCAAHGYDSADFGYFTAYVLRRIRGTILDYLRGQDWLTRSRRQKVKAVQAAQDDGSAEVAELAAATGLSEAQVRDALFDASVGLPVHLDGRPEGHEVQLAAPEDVEGGVVASDLCAYAARTCAQAVAGLELRQQVIVAMYFYAGCSVREIARLLKMSITATEEALAEASFAVHARLREALADGQGAGGSTPGASAA